MYLFHQTRIGTLINDKDIRERSFAIKALAVVGE